MVGAGALRQRQNCWGGGENHPTVGAGSGYFSFVEYRVTEDSGLFRCGIIRLREM